MTKYWVYCKNNNFFNYTHIMIEDFDSENKLTINNLTNDIIETIKNNKINGYFLENYFYDKFFLNITKNNNLSLVDLDIFYSNFEDFQDICEYLSKTIDKKYKNNLKEIFIRNFNSSYSNFIEKYLINEIDSKMYINIFEKLNMKIDYIKKKIIEENAYYLFLLNKTKNIGISTKEALLSLYPILFLKVNDTIHQILNKFFEEDLYFYLLENRKLFFENYFNFLTNNSMEINKFTDYFDYITSDTNFNRTLENISLSLITNMINLLKNKYIISFKEKLNNVTDLLFYLKNQIQNSLTNINILNHSDHSISIANMNKNYTELINQQNNEFNFNVSGKPFIYLDNFTFMYLSSPLSEIKIAYAKIEKDLLNKLFNLIDNFDDFYGFIKDKLNKTKKLENIEIIYNITNNLIETNTENFSNEIYDIKNQLYEYTEINRLRQNNEKIRNLNETNFANKKQINLFESNHKINKYKRNHKIKDNKYESTKNYFTHHNKYYNRNLDFNSQQGSYNLYHIVKVFKVANQIFSAFSKSISSSEFKKISNNLNIFIMKNENFLICLENSIKLSVFKFSTFLTSKKLLELEEKIYYQYNLINPYITDYLREIYDNILTFIRFINSTTFKYDQIFIELNSTIVSNYKELSDLINDKYNVKFNGIFLRNLEWINEGWSLPISFTINILDYLGEKSPNEILQVDLIKLIAKKEIPLKIKLGVDIFIGIGLELGWEWEDILNQTTRTFYVDLYAGVSLSLFAELGFYFKGGKNHEFNFAFGIKINVGEFKDGIKYEKTNEENNTKNHHHLKLYSEISSLKIVLYIYFEYKYKGKIPITIRIDLVKELFKGYNYTIYEITPKNVPLFYSTLATKYLIFGLGNEVLIFSSYFVLGYIHKKELFKN